MAATHRVTLGPTAIDDLLAIFEYVRGEGGRHAAHAYVDRIEAACRALDMFPERGAPRDDLLPGLRMLGFERRAAILYTVQGKEVSVLRVIYGGQDLARIFGQDESS